MRNVEGWTGLAAVAAMLAALPAGAAPGRQAWARVGEWEVVPSRAGTCSADRVYPGGTRLSVSRSEGGYSSLSVVNRDWSMRTPGHYKLRHVQGGARRSLAGEANTFLRGLGVIVPSDSLIARLAGGGVLEIVHPDGRLIERLDLDGLTPALARLGACITGAAAVANFPRYAAPPPPPPPAARSGQVRPARHRTPPHMLFSNEDYPSAAVRAGEEGMVAFRVDIGADGRVTGCTITRSSGSSILDSTTCRLLAMRGRFEPARNHEGKPTPDSYNGRIVWRLPEPPPPPPPSP